MLKSILNVTMYEREQSLTRVTYINADFQKALG